MATIAIKRAKYSACPCGNEAPFLLFKSKLDYQAKLAGLAIRPVPRCAECLGASVERMNGVSFAVKRPDVPWCYPYGRPAR